jgi:hypothetical protein
MTLAALFAAATLAASPPKLAVLQVAPGEGVPQSTAAALTEALVAEVRRQSGADVITQREIVSILSLENQKAMLGCSTDACMAELGGALGTDRLIAGDMAKLGESFLLHVRIVDVKKVRVAAQADRRLRGGTIDDVLDVLPAVIAELLAAAAAPASAPPPAAAIPLAPAGPAAPPPLAAAGAVPESPWVEQAEKVPRAVLDRLYVLTDDDGLFVALAPFQGMDAPVWAGDGVKMYRQHVVGGGQQGRLAFDRVFWEPRSPPGTESRLEMRAARATLTCGARTIPLRMLGSGGARRLLASAQFFAAPFRRVPHLLARGDDGSYFLVDAARDPRSGEAAASPGYRLRVGKKGQLAPVALSQAVGEPGGLVLVTAAGRLVQNAGGAEWVTGASRLPLTTVDVQEAAPVLYGELGPYGNRLGTPCDGKL